MKTKVVWLQYVLPFLVICPSLALAVGFPELSVTTTPSTYFPIVGQEVALQWVLTNAGPGNAAGISVTNFLSPGLQYVGNSGSGTYSSATGIWTVSSLAASSSVSLSVTVTAVAAGLQTNEISTGNVGGNASDTAVLSVTAPQANLSVTTAPNPEFPVVGEQVVFQLVLTNAGPDTITTNITVTNFLSAGLQYVSNNGGSGNGTYNSTTGIWTVLGLASNSSISLAVTTTAIAAGEQTNIVSVGDFGGYSSDTAILDVVEPEADLGVTTTASTNSLAVGQQVTFLWVITNAGPNNIDTRFTVTNFLSAGLQYVSDNSDGAYDPATSVLTFTTLQANASIAVSLVAKATIAGIQTNTITAGVPSGYTDPNLANNTASAFVTVTNVPQLPVADLAISQTGANPATTQSNLNIVNITVGQYVVFTLDVTNYGPSTVSNSVIISDLLPAGLQYVSSSSSLFPPYFGAGNWADNSGMTPGESGTLTITALATNVGTFTNTATVTASGITDPNLANNTSSVVVQVRLAQADLALGLLATTNSITDTNIVLSSNITANVGSQVIFVFGLTNYGPDTINGAVSVSNFLPAGFQFVSSSAGTYGDTYNPTNGVWTIPEITTYSQYTLNITALATNSGIYTNTAIANVPPFTVDSNLSNNVASVVINVPQPQADLAIGVTASTSTAIVGQQVTFTISATDLGPNSVYSPVTITDLLPSGFQYVTNTGFIPYNPTNGTWTLSGFGSTNQFGMTFIGYIVATAVTPGTYTNTATIQTTPGIDPNPNNNTSSVVVTVNTASSAINLVCPANMTVGADGPNGATAVFYNVTASGGCSTPTISSIPASGSIFPIGTNVVNCTASDSCADQASCSFTVIVTPPPLELVCSPDLTIAATDSNGAVVVYYTTVNDGCTLPDVIGSPPSGSTFPVGPTLVNVTATDSYGQQAQCSFKVTVTPPSPPVPTTITTFNYDTNAGLLHLEWTSAAGKVYTVQESLDLNSWQNFLQGVPSGGSLTTNQVPVSNGVSANFFRIREDVPPAPFAGDPIVSVGEGAILGPDGEQIEPTLPFILAVQQYYISQLMTSTPAQLAAQSIISNDVSDQVLANALFIDWLTASNAIITASTPENINAKNDALRFYYLFNIARSPILPGTTGTWARGIAPSVATNLENSGIPVLITLETPTQQQAYTNSCGAKGVPIPPSMYTSAWMNLGQVQDPFISTNLYAELWIYVSTDPPGVCLALPRYKVSPPGAEPATNATIELLGLICLGFKAQADGNCYACFWDNPMGSTWTNRVVVPITNFVSGTNLFSNGGGSCTDCHAGEDSFVVHPNKMPFKMAYMKVAMGITGRSASLNADKWYTPFGVPPSWPQNPNPGIDWGGDNCTKCHTLGDQAGRFPQLSSGTPDYCGTILPIATQTLFDAPSDTVSAGTKPPNPTMPPGSKAGNSKFWGDVEQLYLLCGQPPPEKAAMVPNAFPPARASVSAPSVVGPLYASATMVAVQGAILGAAVTLYTNGVAASSVANVRSPSQIVFNIPALVAGVDVTASQIVDGGTNVSAPMMVDDYFTDFPGPLSAPYLDELPIYQGANVIQAVSDPGVTLTILRNGVQVAQVPTASGVTIIPLTNGTPFQVGDMFQAFETIEGISSTNSDPVYAISDPTSLLAPTLDTLQTYPGQQLITIDGLVGAQTSVTVNGVVVGQFSYPGYSTQFDLTTSGLGRALQAGDQLTLSQSFGTTNMSGPSTNLPPTAPSCDNLPAPSILTPVAGVNYIQITQSIPGAQVYVFDATGTQLGNGSGSTINLNRTIVCGDILTVVQQVGDCTSATGYRITVGPCACQ